MQVPGARRLCSQITSAAARLAYLDAAPRYPAFGVTHSIATFAEAWSHLDAKARVEEEEVMVAGRIVSKRELSAKLYFLDVVQNGNRVQILSERQYWEGDDADAAAEDFRLTHQSLRRGDVIGVRGFPGKSGRGELSVIPRELSVLAPCLRPLPSEREGLTDPELRFGQRYLDLLVNPTSIETLRTRSRVTRFIRDFFHNEGFDEVETPTLWPSASGASAAPFVTDRAAASGKELFLRIAPELFLKQLVIGGMDRVFEVGKVFRNEGVTPRHNPEFTMVEAYAAYADREFIMSMTERLLSSLVKDLTGGYILTVQRPLVPLGSGGGGGGGGEEEEEEGSEVEMETVEIDFTPPFRRVSMLSELESLLDAPGLQKVVLRSADGESASVDEAEALLSACCEQVDIVCPTPRTVPRLLDRLASHLIERPAMSPVFVCDQPLALSPLAKEHTQAGAGSNTSLAGCADRFELLVAGQELANAYVELNDPEEQRKRFQEQDALLSRGDSDAVRKDDAFCEALEYGLPPTAGWGLGVDRLTMLVTNSAHIREVLCFPTSTR